LGFDGGIHFFDEGVYVGAALGWGFSVWKNGCGAAVDYGGVGVEVVVDVDAVDIVAFDDVEDDVECALLGEGG